MNGLEKLKTIRYILNSERGKDKSIDKDFDIIEKELQDKEKKDKFVEIIKNKSIDLMALRHAFIEDKEGEQSGFEWYNSAMLVRRKVYDTLTQEEYDLLKEVLL